MDRNKLSYGKDIWNLKSNIENCIVLHIESKNIRIRYKLSNEEIKKVNEERDTQIWQSYFVYFIESKCSDWLNSQKSYFVAEPISMSTPHVCKVRGSSICIFSLMDDVGSWYGRVVDVRSWTIVVGCWCRSSRRIQLDDRCGKLRSVESLNAAGRSLWVAGWVFRVADVGRGW